MEVTVTRPMTKIHREILLKLKRYGAVIDMPNANSFRFPRGRTMYNVVLLDEMRAARWIDADNHLTANGELVCLLNS